MRKHILLALTFCLGLLLGYSLTFLNAFTAAIDYPPSENQSQFAKTCSQLNGKELTLQNVEQIAGWSFNNGFTKATNENIQRLHNGTDPFFNIYQKKEYDNTWICAIGKDDDGRINAWIYYQFE